MKNLQEQKVTVLPVLLLMFSYLISGCGGSSESGAGMPGQTQITGGDTGGTPAGTGQPARAAAATRGQHLFEVETFDGNGRTCATCHSGPLRSITPEHVQALFAENPADPLFTHDAANDFGDVADSDSCVPVSFEALCTTTGWAEVCHLDVINDVIHECETSFSRLLTHATIRVPIDLHPNVSVLGAEGRVFLNRGVPTSVDIALDPVIMSDGRAPTLQAQAADAAQGHAQSGSFTAEDLDAIAEFESSEFSSEMLAAYAAGGPEPVLPEGTTAAEKRGRDFFITPEETGKLGFCGMCHSGPMLNEMGIDILLPGPTANQIPGLEALKGERFITALVSETNLMANPVKVWTIMDEGIPKVIVSPDIGLGAITGKWLDANKFKIPSLWGSNDRAPFFHDNSAKTVEEMVDHYANFAAPTFRVVLTPQDKADIIAYMKLL